MPSETTSTQSVTSVHLPDPEKIRRRLGSHFHHKIAVTVAEDFSHLNFGIGTCELRSDGQQLWVECRADSELELHEIQRTLERHLLGMAQVERHSIQWRNS
jgi:hypothetical protein